MRAALPFAGVAIILLAGGMMLNRFYTDAAFLPPDDFLHYWAAGRLNATGGDPYDADQLLALQREAGRPVDKPAVMMWNPPWVLSLAMPFGLLPPRTSQLFWLLAQLAILVWSADRFWSAFGGEAKHRPWVWGGAIAFYPLMYLVFAGQSSGWLLLGLAGLLSTNRMAMLLPFLAVKPHLFVPIWIVLLLEAIRTVRSRTMLGIGLSVGVAATVVPVLVNPEVWPQYFAAMSRPVDAAHSPLSGWRSPLIGWWVRNAVMPEAFWIQAVPTALLAILTPIYWWQRRTNWDWSAELPRLVLAGLVCSPYGAWPYDQIVLLVPLAAGLAALVGHGLRIRLAAGLLALGIVNGIAMTIREGEHFVWVPPAIAVWYAWASSVRHAVTPQCHSVRPALVGAAQ
ncbi:MAG: glycosyltransferase 87 family protein [Gemmataceae bacterium]